MNYIDLLILIDSPLWWRAIFFNILVTRAPHTTVRARRQVQSPLIRVHLQVLCKIHNLWIEEGPRSGRHHLHSPREVLACLSSAEIGCRSEELQLKAFQVSRRWFVTWNTRYSHVRHFTGHVFSSRGNKNYVCSKFGRPAKAFRCTFWWQWERWPGYGLTTTSTSRGWGRRRRNTKWRGRGTATDTINSPSLPTLHLAANFAAWRRVWVFLVETPQSMYVVVSCEYTKVWAEETTIFVGQEIPHIPHFQE